MYKESNRNEETHRYAYRKKNILKNIIDVIYYVGNSDRGCTDNCSKEG